MKGGAGGPFWRGGDDTLTVLCVALDVVQVTLDSALQQAVKGAFCAEESGLALFDSIRQTVQRVQLPHLIILNTS